MFNLFRSRAKVTKILLGGLLTIVAISMLLYLIPGFGLPTGDTGDQVIAEVGKTAVTVTQVEQQVRNQLQNRQLPPDLAAIYIPQIVDQAIADRAVAYEAEQLGFRVSDRDLADALRSLPFGNQPPDQYRQYVEQQLGMTVPDFENNLRLKLYQDSVNMFAVEGVLVTPAEAEVEFHKRNDKIKLVYVGFDSSKLAAGVKPTPDEVKAYFDRNKGLFPMPETRSVQLIVADQAKVAQSIQVSDAQVQDYYNSHRDQYRTPERVNARHILFSTANKPKEEAPKVQAQAEDVLKQIKAGGDFAELAKKYSQDTGSAVKGGDLGWVVRGQMVKNFEESVFSLKPKEISGVIGTEYGFHIIQVLEKEPAQMQPLDKVKDQIVAGLRNQSVFDHMQELADQAHAALVKAPQNAQQIANQLGLDFVNVDRFAQGGNLPGLGADPQLGATIAVLKPGEVSQLVQVNNKLAAAVVTAIRPPHPAEYSEVESAVRQNMIQTTAVQLVKEKSEKAAGLLKQNGGDLNAIAKAVGLQVTTTDFFARNGAAEGIGSASFLGDSFNLPVGSTFGPVSVGTQTIIGKIVDRQAADMSKLPQERDQIVLQLKSKKFVDRQILMQDSILTQLIQSGKVKKHQDVINRLIARYRG
jgi:peptidyl-prolyl cis-trans isomerase D